MRTILRNRIYTKELITHTFAQLIPWCTMTFIIPLSIQNK